MDRWAGLRLRIERLAGAGQGRRANADPFSWASAWLVTAGGVLALANLLCVAV